MGHNSGAPTYRRTYIRQWRAHRKMTLETLAERVGAKVGGMTHASLSRIERGLSPERLRGGTRAASIEYWLSMEESLRRHRGRRRHVGNLAISDVSISGAGQAIAIDQGGTLAVTLDLVTSTGASEESIQLAGVAGSFTATTVRSTA